MKKVAFVPIKLNNQRTPGKNLRPFSDGMPLLTFFLSTLVKVREFDKIYLFCSDEVVKSYIIDGVDFLKRPKYLDSQEATPQDIINEFIIQVDADIYAVCHCTSPFVSAEHISECVKAVESGEYDSSFTGEKVQKLMWTDRNKPLNFDPANVPRTQDLQVYYNEISAAYVFRKDVFEKYRRRIGINPYITEVRGIECIDIDYPEDFEIADAIYTRIVRY